MGLFIHHAFIVTDQSIGSGKIEEIRGYAQSLGFSVSNVISGCVNEVYSFLISPDGSKEFWPESEDFNEKRNLISDYLKKSTVDWVLVRYGECAPVIESGSREWDD